VELPDDGTQVAALASCLAGKKIIGGGFTLAQASSTDINVTVSRPVKTGRPNNGLAESGDDFDMWRAVFVNPAGGTGVATGRAYAICAAAP
jgi:hypothetical protein